MRLLFSSNVLISGLQGLETEIARASVWSSVGLPLHVIDKTRAAIKDLHLRIGVALHAVNSIAKRIERMRDEELQPQLTELITGFIRMWKAMLECHHAGKSDFVIG